jgi:hypothetical protein
MLLVSLSSCARGVLLVALTAGGKMAAAPGPLPWCAASNGTLDDMRFRLRLAGLLARGLRCIQRILGRG